MLRIYGAHSQNPKRSIPFWKSTVFFYSANINASHLWGNHTTFRAIYTLLEFCRISNLSNASDFRLRGTQPKSQTIYTLLEFYRIFYSANINASHLWGNHTTFWAKFQHGNEKISSFFPMPVK